MLVSVIIPVYNGEKFIKKCVDSVLNQTHKNLEIILYDDASSDHSKEIIQQLEKTYPDQIRGIFATKNLGAGAAKNGGLREARGNYLVFIDVDDYITPDYIEAMTKKVEENHNLDLVLTNFTKVDQDGKNLYVRDYQTKDRAFIQEIFSWGKMYRKAWLDRYQLCPPQGKVLDDVLFHAGHVLANPVYDFIPNTGYCYVINPSSITHTTLTSFKKGALKQATDYLKDLKRLVDTPKKEQLLCYYAFQYICWHLLKSGCHVGKKAMKEEYQMAFEFLDQEFSGYRKNKLIGAFGFKEERFIVHVTLFWVRFFHRCHLSKFFFICYSKVNLQKLWPSS